METKRIFQFALAFTIAAFMSGCEDSKSSPRSKDAGVSMDALDARVTQDALPTDPKPGEPIIDNGDAPTIDAGRLGSEVLSDTGRDGGPLDTPPIADVPAADAPIIDAPADRVKSREAGGDVAPVCSEGTTESCASPGNPLIGACHAGTHTCLGGVWGPCSETLPASAESCDGSDDNCNGMIDEGCAAGCMVVCAHCSGSGDGAAANGSIDHPYASIEAAIAAVGANDAGTRQRICVVGGASCSEIGLYSSTGPLKVPDGLIIQGSYAITETGLTYCGVAGVRPKTTLSFTANEGVVFDDAIVAGVELSSINIEVYPPSGSSEVADTVTPIAIKGGKNVTLSRVYVAEGFLANNTRGVSVTAGGQVTITGSSISTGQGKTSAVGLYVNDGTVTLRNNCDKLVNGRCESSCYDGGSMQGIHGYVPANSADAPAQSSGAYIVAGSTSFFGNMLCGGSTSIAEGQSPATVATLRCEGNGCASIAGNVIVGASDSDALAVALVGANPLFDSNQVIGGCGRRTTTGLRMEGSSSRVQNNRIVAGQCSTADAPIFRALHLISSGSSVNPDIHSNTIEPLGLASPCQSIGIQVDLAAGATSATSGVLRNNIISAGACDTRLAISEAAGASLKSLQNNDLYGPQDPGATATPILYRHAGSDVTSVDQVNALPLAANNISADPQYSAYPTDWHLTADSPCLDKGTSAGAPTNDGNGNPRPAGEGYDIGAFELAM